MFQLGLAARTTSVRISTSSSRPRNVDSRAVVNPQAPWQVPGKDDRWWRFIIQLRLVGYTAVWYLDPLCNPNNILALKLLNIRSTKLRPLSLSETRWEATRNIRRYLQVRPASSPSTANARPRPCSLTQLWNKLWNGYVKKKRPPVDTTRAYNSYCRLHNMVFFKNGFLSSRTIWVLLVHQNSFFIP